MAATLAAQYRKAGMSQSDAFRQAWSEIERTSKSKSRSIENDMTGVRTQGERTASALKSQGEKAASALSNAAKRTASVTKTALRGMATVAKGASVAAGAVWGAVGVVGVKYNAQIEQLQTSFEVMTGSAEKAADVIARVRKIAAETPFEMSGLAATTQLLMNYGMTADDAIGRMTMLGDIAQGNGEKMTRIATAYGQMSSAGKVHLEDVKQMIEAGFNPLQIISEKTGESMESLYKRISKGTLAVSEITGAMVTATSEGGRYYQSMEKQAKTLPGLFSTLKDTIQEFTGDLMLPLSNSLRTDVLPDAIRTVSEIQGALASGGFEGVLDYVNARMPELLSAGTAMSSTLIKGVVKGLPDAAKMLVGALPTILKAVVSTAPELVQGGMSVLTELASGIIAQLPSIVPVLIGGVADVTKALVVGSADLLDDMLGEMAKVLGVVTQNNALELAMRNVDQGELKAFREAFGEVKTSVSMTAKVDDTATGTITAAVSKLRGVLLDLEKDGVITEAQRKNIETLISEDVDPILTALQGAGVDTTTPEGSTIAGKITAAAVDLHRAI
ncbi:MAG: tape measure protein, partial [Clostridia bacterium]